MSVDRYNKKDRELSALQKKYADLEALIADLEGKLSAAISEKERWQTEYGVSRRTLCSVIAWIDAIAKYHLVQ